MGSVPSEKDKSEAHSSGGLGYHARLSASGSSGHAVQMVKAFEEGRSRGLQHAWAQAYVSPFIAKLCKTILDGKCSLSTISTASDCGS